MLHGLRQVFDKYNKTFQQRIIREIIDLEINYTQVMNSLLKLILCHVTL